MPTSTDINISLTNIFSNSHFKRVISDPDYPLLEIKLDEYKNIVAKGYKTRHEALSSLYEYMLANYRCEYVYKNFITKKILLGRHSLNTSTLINEFKVSSSKADAVLFNGAATVYEIKTELDSPDRLSNQIEDYQKAFKKIYLVVHHSQIDKYKKILNDSSVGLLALSPRYHLSPIKQARINARSLDIKTMFKCLRKDEYSAIIKKVYGSIPDVPNMYYFKECLNLARQIDPDNFHQLMNVELKKRKPKEGHILNSGKLPSFLKNICLSIDPTSSEYSTLFKYLNKKI